MDPFVVLRLPDGSRATLRHGDLVGRLETAALHIADPRISEAHAMVSLRGATLKLLALRGRLAVEGFAVRDVELVAGLTIALAGEVALVVERVGLPEQILGLAIGSDRARGDPDRGSRDRHEAGAHVRDDGPRPGDRGAAAARARRPLHERAHPARGRADHELRAKWDVTLSRLRKKLVAGGVRSDLVRADGHGNIELCLAPGDSAHDET